MNFGGGAAAGGAGGGNVSAGADLDEVNTEQLAFQSVSGEDKLRLLPSTWPSDNLPPTTSSLLSIAASKGLVAAAGPDTLVIASTDSVRQSFINEAADAENKVKNFTPQASLQIPRVSQVVFSSDESCLVIAAEQGGGLAVYDTSALVNGGKEPAFQLATEGQSVRQLVPNPNPSPEFSRYFGIVTANGQLLLADLKDRKLVSGSNGSVVFHERVSCACWSRLGKQIVAGLADGTAAQIDPQGVVKATIPEPPQLASWKDASSIANPITSIFWLETYDWLLIHTPVLPPGATEGPTDSIYHLAHKDKATSSFTFRRFVDPCPAFGLPRTPSHHFIQRLREWLELGDLLVLASTASTDIGIFSRSRIPLDPQHQVAETFTYTQLPDGRRAAMPMGAGASDTSPIGMCLDLSAKEKVARPIPNDESLEESPVPLPALWVLSNEGMLSMWWVVYNESVRKAQAYPDLVAAGGPRALEEKKGPQQPAAASHAHPQAASSSPFGSAPKTSTFGQPQSAFSSGTSNGTSAFGSSSTNAQASPFGQQATPAKPAFGTPSSQPAFGQSSTPAFGQSAFGNRQSVWGSSGAPAVITMTGGSAFGKPSFSNPNGSAFGTPSQAAPAATNAGSQFGKPAFGTPSQPAFGASGFGGMGANKGSVWGTPAQASPQAQQPASSGSVFGGNASQQSPFLKVGNNAASSGFASFAGGNKENQQPSPSPFAATSKPSMPKDPSGSTVSLGNGTSFGSGSTMFGVQSFGTPAQPASKEESMVDDEDQSSQTSTIKPASSQQTSSEGAFGLGAGGFKLGSTFKPDGTAKDDLPKPKDAGSSLFGGDFGKALGDTAKQKTSEDAAWWSGQTTPASNPVIKKEPGTENEPKLADIPPAEEEKAEPVDDAPLPPDPTTWKPKPGALPPPLPPGFGEDSTAIANQKEATESKSDDASPPNETHTSKKHADERESEAPAPGTPLVDMGGPGHWVPSDTEDAGPPESGGEGSEWSDEDENDEGDEEDEQDHTPQQIQDPKALSTFESRLTPASPKRSGAKEESTTPATEKKDSYTPAGMPKAPIMFPPPQRSTQDSPRSPSPVRSATSPLRSMPSFGSQQVPNKQFPQQSGSTAPAQPIQPKAAQLVKKPPTQAPQRIAVPPAQLVRKSERPASSKQAEPAAGDLEDEEDARVQSILSAPVEPTKEVPAFLAHQDYVAGSESGVDKPGLGGQIERVFRDINSMIDTLALNARSLRGFVDGNASGDDAVEKGRLELEEEESWVLGEASELDRVIDGIEVELADGRIHDVRDLLEGLREEEKEMSRLRAKGIEIRKLIAVRSDQDQLAQQQNASLPMESQAQQSELRQGVQQVQKLLAKAEEQLSVLRAELASLPQQSQNGAGTRRSVPTVEAVTNTILKMTAMVEKRSGDIDVLESQIKRLGGVSALGLGQNYEDELAASMKASRLSQSSPLALRASRSSPFASRMRASRATPPVTLGARRSLFDVDQAEIEAYRVKKEGRRRVVERLVEQLGFRGPRVVKVGQ